MVPVTTNQALLYPHHFHFSRWIIQELDEIDHQALDVRAIEILMAVRLSVAIFPHGTKEGTLRCSACCNNSLLRVNGFSHEDHGAFL